MTGAFLQYRIGQWVSDGLPRRRALWLAEHLADRYWRRAGLDRSAVQANLGIILGRSVPDGSPLVREVFRNFARYLVEFFSADRDQRLSVTVEGYDWVSDVRRTRRGSIILSAHLGNWELGAILLRRLGLPMSVVVRPHGDPEVNRLFDRQRLRCGVGVVPLGGRTTSRCVELLRGGGALGILVDREFGRGGIPVSFFGRQATVPRGPAVLSLRTDAAVLPVLSIRETPGAFRLYIERPICPPQGPWTQTHVQALTQRYVNVIERYIKRFPSQWLMFESLGHYPKAERSEPTLAAASGVSAEA